MSGPAPLREVDIRPAEVFARYVELTQQDAERMFADRSAFVEVACPGCGARRAMPAFDKAGFSYVECGDCRSLYVSPRPTEASLGAFYADSPSATYWAEVFFPASVATRRERIFAPRAERVLALAGAAADAPMSVIDVGAGYGLFLDEIHTRRPSATLLAVEPGRALADVCRGKGFDTLEEPVEQASAWAGRGDVVVCFEVLEHVFDADAFARAVVTLARPGGLVVLSSLGADGFDIRVLWERSKSVSPPHHLNFLSVAGFEGLAARAGLRDVQVLTPGQLDVDIVRSAFDAAPELRAGNRFVDTLLRRETQGFQEFLVQHRLSSHVWMVGRRA